MSRLLTISHADKCEYIERLLLPSFNEKYNLNAVTKDEWLMTRAKEYGWTNILATALIDMYGTIKTIEEAKEERDVQRRLEYQESKEREEKEKERKAQDSSTSFGQSAKAQTSSADGKSPDLFCEYQRCPNSLEDAIRRIERSPDTFRHYVLFLQSSGYGKTRLCLDILQERHGIYLLCCNVTDGFTQSAIVAELLSRVKAISGIDANTHRLELLIKFMSQLEVYMSHFDDPLELYNQQFDVYLKTYKSSFTDPKGLLSTSPPDKKRIGELFDAARADMQPTTPPTPPEPPAPNKRYDSPPAAALRSGRLRTRPLVPGDLPISATTSRMKIVVFDEAHELGAEVLALLKIVLDRFNIIGIFLSTCGHLHELLPTSSSYRGSGRAAVDPVFGLQTTDIYGGVDNKLVLGRPLWYHLRNTRLKNDTEVVTYALYRLCGNASNCNSLSAKLSLFMCRFGGLYPSDFKNASDFVTKHLATYVRIGVQEIGATREVTSSVAYPSEPVLAEASAFCTSALCPAGLGCSKLEILKAVKEEIEKSAGIVKLNKGDLGELLACALVGYQLDYIREAIFEKENKLYSAQNMSTNVPVNELLIALFSEAGDVSELDRLQGYVVNATHFVRLPYKTAYSTCAVAIARGAGVITYENSRAIDFYLESFQTGQGVGTPLLDIPTAAQNGSAESMGEGPVTASPLNTFSQTIGPVLCEIEAIGVAAKAKANHGDEGCTRMGKLGDNVVYKTAKGAIVYFVGRTKHYLRKGDRERIIVDAVGETIPALPGSVDDAGSVAGVAQRPVHAYDNVHIRFSVKNYAHGITRTEAESMMDDVDVFCEPTNAVQNGGAEKLSVTVLINVGPGVLEPFVTVSKPRTLRSSTAEAHFRTHIKLAVGLNFTSDDTINNADNNPERRCCFKYFPAELLKLIRDAAGSQIVHKEAELSMILGRSFNCDRLRCMGENEKESSVVT